MPLSRVSPYAKDEWEFVVTNDVDVADAGVGARRRGARESRLNIPAMAAAWYRREERLWRRSGREAEAENEDSEQMPRASVGHERRTGETP